MNECWKTPDSSYRVWRTRLRARSPIQIILMSQARVATSDDELVSIMRMARTTAASRSPSRMGSRATSLARSVASEYAGGSVASEHAVDMTYPGEGARGREHAAGMTYPGGGAWGPASSITTHPGGGYAGHAPYTGGVAGPAPYPDGGVAGPACPLPRWWCCRTCRRGTCPLPRWWCSGLAPYPGVAGAIVMPTAQPQFQCAGQPTFVTGPPPAGLRLEFVPPRPEADCDEGTD